MVRILMRLGLFGGAFRTADEEASFFVVRNEFLLQRAGGSWDRPLPCQEMLAKPDFFQYAVDLMRRGVFSYHFLEYTGIGGALRRVASTPGVRWGWKDPRNVFTLPVWQAVFPEAKLLMIHRNGIDVAHSLNRRARGRNGNPLPRGLLNTPSTRRRLINLLRPVAVFGEGYSARCTELADSFAVWEEYTSEALAQYETWTNAKMSLRFEDLLSEPDLWIQRLADFCELPVSQDRLGDITRELRPERAFAFRKGAEHQELYEQFARSPAMQAVGYGGLVSSLNEPHPPMTSHLPPEDSLSR